MRAPARLGLYGAGLVAVFAVAFATAGAVVPEATVQAWACLLYTSDAADE